MGKGETLMADEVDHEIMKAINKRYRRIRKLERLLLRCRWALIPERYPSLIADVQKELKGTVHELPTSTINKPE